MEMKLELVLLPVKNVDESIAFYAEKVGFHLDHDVQPGNGMRVVQLTPPGSACSIGFGVDLADDLNPVKGTHLVVKDVAKAREMLLQKSVDVGEVQDFGGGVKSAFFSDPDGNTWELQEIAADAHL
jgi:catechol 2,3-dioxygenase-like lactoylglutathione lyase family enzyme